MELLKRGDRLRKPRERGLRTLLYLICCGQLVSKTCGEPTVTIPSHNHFNENNLDDDDHARTIARLRANHLAPHPVLAAGQWVARPQRAHRASKSHMACLAMERQGPCLSKDGHRRRSNKPFLNGPDISHGFDNYSWVSNDYQYRALDPPNYQSPHSVQLEQQNVRQILRNRRFHLVGDSLTRQWAHLLNCSLYYQYKDTGAQVFYHARYFDRFDTNLTDFIRNATVPPGTNDFLIFNFGHHFTDGRVGGNSTQFYEEFLTNITKMDFPMPDANIYYRTTSPRHFPANQVDWQMQTTTRVTGGTAPNNNATWYMYGGNLRKQPEQNLIAFDTVGKRFKILDTAPMMVARADATLDGSHVCIPGPMEFWTRMLLYRLYHEHGMAQQNNATSHEHEMAQQNNTTSHEHGMAQQNNAASHEHGIIQQNMAAPHTFHEDTLVNNDTAVTSVPREVNPSGSVSDLTRNSYSWKGKIYYVVLLLFMAAALFSRRHARFAPRRRRLL